MGAMGSHPTLDVSRFVVLGEGLGAGLADFAWSSPAQERSFPAFMARQMKTPFRQPLMQATGPANIPGFETLPVRIPGPTQDTVFRELVSGPYSNLSIPGLTLEGALGLRPAPPIVRRDDPLQTACNLVLGFAALARGESSLLTAVENAVAQRPTLALVSLGYTEFTCAAIRADTSQAPCPVAFKAQYTRMLSSLRQSGAAVIALTIPDPLDTAYFATPASAAKTLRLTPDCLAEFWGIRSPSLLTLTALNEVGFQVFSKSIAPLSVGSVMPASTATALSRALCRCNRAIAEAAAECGAALYDLYALFHQVRTHGALAATRLLTADYLGGWYSLNGLYPGEAAHALIANELLRFLNDRFGTRFCPAAVETILATDPAAGCQPATGPCWTPGELRSVFDSIKRAAPKMPLPPKPIDPDKAAPLRLPPDLQQVLPLNPAASYFGDAIGATNARSPGDITWGAGGNFLFGGFAMVDSHLSGSLRIRFSPASGGLADFQIDFQGGFTGSDAILAAPQCFHMGFQNSRVLEVPGRISAGTVNLSTGEVSNLEVFAQYSSTALGALVGVNPTFPRPDKQPLSFPGPYGSAWARFDQRDDGKLDFTFYGSAFVPLGKDIRWPLNFVGPSGQFATIPAQGTVMHPHLALTTRDSDREPAVANVPQIPQNVIREITLHTHNSAFGDDFRVHIPDLGGTAKGRSHIMGRLQIQFGPRCGDTVPIAVCDLGPGGVLGKAPESPITRSFPSQLPRGPHGFSEVLRFPLRSYTMDELAVVDDPFDISVAAIDLRTGRAVLPMLHRAFIEQDLIYAFLRVEPRTPRSSFFFRGPADFSQTSDGRLAFRFNSIVRVPYPQGFSFPQPNLSEPFIVGPDSRLEPYLWLRSVEDVPAGNFVFERSETGLVSSRGERFSYRAAIPAPGVMRRPEFVFENHTQKGTFRLTGVVWVSFGASLQSSPGDSQVDTVTFSCYGVWTKDGKRAFVPAAVQICSSLAAPYVGIQVDSADVSSVNTKPELEVDALP